MCPADSTCPPDALDTLVDTDQAWEELWSRPRLETMGISAEAGDPELAPNTVMQLVRAEKNPDQINFRYKKTDQMIVELPVDPSTLSMPGPYALTLHPIDGQTQAGLLWFGHHLMDTSEFTTGAPLYFDEQGQLTDSSAYGVPVGKTVSTGSIFFWGGNVGLPSSDTERMRWRGNWINGQQYAKNDVSLDFPYLMIANTLTTDRPGPQPTGQPEYKYQGTSPVELFSGKVLTYGTEYQFDTNVSITAWRVYVTAGTVYRIYYETADVVTEIMTFEAVETGWKRFEGFGHALPVGYTFTPFVESHPAEIATTVDLTYDYQTPQNDGVPDDGEIIHSRGTPNHMRISKVPQAGNPIVLETLEAGDKISGAGVVWTVQGSTDAGTYYQVDVSPAMTGSSGTHVFTVDETIEGLIPAVIDYDYWLTDTSVRSFYTIDGAPVVITEHAYGIDIEVQDVIVSDDWDFLASSSSSTGGGDTGGGGGASTFLELVDTPGSFTNERAGLEVNSASNALILHDAGHLRRDGDFLMADSELAFGTSLSNRAAYLSYAEAFGTFAIVAGNSDGGYLGEYVFRSENGIQGANDVLKRNQNDARYLELSGGTMTGNVTFDECAISANNLTDPVAYFSRGGNNGNVVRFRHMQDDGTVVNQLVIRTRGEGVGMQLVPADAVGDTTDESALNAVQTPADGGLPYWSYGLWTDDFVGRPRELIVREDLDGYVAKAGDTMTGPLIMTGVDVDQSSIIFQTDPGVEQYIVWNDEFSARRAFLGYSITFSGVRLRANAPAGGSATDFAFLSSDVVAIDESVLRRVDADARYLTLSGGTMTGFLTLNEAPSDDLHAATKKYVDDGIAALPTPITAHSGLTGLDADDHVQYYNQSRGDARYLTLSGGTLTGLLTLSGVPSDDLHAATKKYVDDGIGGLPAPITVHSGLTGLDADDHPQYNTQARGDARYLQLSGGNLVGKVNLDMSVRDLMVWRRTDTNRGMSLTCDNGGGMSSMTPQWSDDGVAWTVVFSRALAFYPDMNYWVIGNSNVAANMILKQSDGDARYAPISVTTTLVDAVMRVATAAGIENEVSALLASEGMIMDHTAFTNGSMAGTPQQWEYDRQQNIIDSIDEEVASPTVPDSTAPATLTKRRAEALAVQNYLVKSVLASEAANAAVDAADAEWIENNPRPEDPADVTEPA